MMDALGDSYFVHRRGWELLRAVERGDPNYLKERLYGGMYAHPYFQNDADGALEAALEYENQSKLVPVLLEDVGFVASLSYRTLLEAAGKARGTPLEKIFAETLREVESDRFGKPDGLIEYMRYVESVYNKEDGRSILKGQDAFVFAAEKCDLMSLFSLISCEYKRYIDEETAEFVIRTLQGNGTPEIEREHLELLFNSAIRERELAVNAGRYNGLESKKAAIEREERELLRQTAKLEERSAAEKEILGNIEEFKEKERSKG